MILDHRTAAVLMHLFSSFSYVCHYETTNNSERSLKYFVNNCKLIQSEIIECFDHEIAIVQYLVSCETNLHPHGNGVVSVS
jgi:hypothetical protein